ncbi:MAG: pilus assembly protein PilQ [Thiobacillus sp. 65-29]|nr:MAG: pilus assembly protein PilQ [Thiobacillus sp. 65-29]
MNALPKIAYQFACRMLGAVALAAVALLPAAHAADTPPTANAVQSVETTTLPGGKVMVRVNLKQPLATTPAGFTVGNPPRIALDLPDTGNAMGRNVVEANLGPLTSVNVVQAGTRTRVVLNLSKAAEYEARVDGTALYVALGDAGTGLAPVNATPRFAEAGPSDKRHGIRDVDFRRGVAGEGRIVTTLSDAQTGINIRQQANGVVVDFVGTDLPKALQRRLDVADFGTPVQTVEAYALGDNTRMVITPKGAWEYSAYQTENSFIVEVKPAVDGQKRTADGKVKYVGEKLSLNFQNVEVRSVLQVIADFTGLNIIASDTVTGNLTLRLKDVPWDQALDLIMQTKGLDKRQNGNVIWVAPKDELFTKEKLEFEAKAAVEDLEPMVTEYIPLNYMRADEAQTMLYGFAGGASLRAARNQAVNCSAEAQGITSAAAGQASQQGKDSDQKMLSKRGRATYELKTNTLIITDTARKIQEIRELLARLDVPTRQVMIEARVVIADSQWGRQLGARLATGISGTTSLAGSQTGISFSGTQSGATAGVATNHVNLPITSTTTPGSFGLSLLNIATGNLISLELQALEADNRGKILSSPRIVTSNQKPAVILQGEQIPYVTQTISTAGVTTTVTFKDAFLCLLVDPQILNNDSIIMNVEIQKDARGPVIQAPGINAPTIETKRAKTQVRVNNGETAVLGGIFEEVNRNDISKVPFFGDLPFLGHLFKQSNKQEEKIELLIFLTPRILDERLSLR